MAQQQRQTSRAYGVHYVALSADAHTTDGTQHVWVELLPAGVFAGRDGRGPYTTDADAVLAAYAAGKIDLPVDYDHQSLSAAEKAGPVPAAGWITALESRGGAIWGLVEWVRDAAQLIAARAYRYLSPVFRHDKDGRVLSLEGVGLTHYPNLHLTPVAHTQGDDTMTDDLLERLRFLLNLPALATIEEIVAEIDKIKARLSAAETAAQSRSPDPREWVPMSQHRAVADELAALQKRIAAEQADAAVAAAMSEGKIAPALKDWATDYARRDPQGFAAFAAAAPVLVSKTPAPEHKHDRTNQITRHAFDALSPAERMAMMRSGAQIIDEE